MDRFLSEPLRRAEPDELGRYRVLVGIALFLLLVDGTTLLFLPVHPQPWVAGPVVTFSALMVASSLVLLRQRSSHQLPAALVIWSIVIAFMFSSLGGKNPYTASHAAGMLLPALSVYLVGARQGLVITLLTGVFVGIIHPLHFTTPGVADPPVQASMLWRMDTFAVICMLGIWAVSWMHTSARAHAHAAREQALRTLHESERKLHSLIENTADVACALDTEGRLIIGNSAMRRAYRERYGREPLVGEHFVPQEPAPAFEVWKKNLARVFNGQHLRFEDTLQLGDKVEVRDVSMHPIFGEDGKPLGLTLFGRDVTERKEAETKLSEMHRTLLDVSRQAGMAEVATGLLHNVGNTLNSVNVSANLVTERIRASRVGGLARATELLREHSENLGTFLSTDPRGKQLPGYLIAISGQLVEEQQALLAEQRLLTESIEHVKSIVSMQQEHARFSGVKEVLAVPRLIDDALRLHSSAFERLGIEIRREYAEVPSILVDRHKLLQILLNLLSNARHALLDSGHADKRLTIRVGPSSDGHLRIQVSDNGVGIGPETLARLFTQGFTTKKDGHGFGLHISALAAAEMSGNLTCASEGRGQGATFTLELPIRHEEARS
jgi:PAS domain S-box-containing protein